MKHLFCILEKIYVGVPKLYLATPGNDKAVNGEVSMRQVNIGRKTQTGFFAYLQHPVLGARR